MSDSVRPHRRQPTRLPRPWESPGKNTGVGCHFLLQCMKLKSESEVAQLCLTLSNPMDCSLPGSSVHRIFQARVLKWGAIAFCITRTGVMLMTDALRNVLGQYWKNNFQTHPTFRNPIVRGKFSWHLLRKKKNQTSKQDKVLRIPNCWRNVSQNDTGKSNVTIRITTNL